MFGQGWLLSILSLALSAVGARAETTLKLKAHPVNRSDVLSRHGPAIVKALPPRRAISKALEPGFVHDAEEQRDNEETSDSRIQRQVATTVAPNSTTTTSSTTQAHYPLDSQRSGGWVFTMQMEVAGTPMDILVDTGSSQFWAASESCPDCKTGNMTIPPLSGYAGCDNGTLYYGMGEVTGCIVPADLGIGQYHLANQSIVAAREIDSHLKQEGAFLSGIMGVGQANGDAIDSAPPLQQLYESGQIDAPTVGFYLNRDSQSEESSEITFGDVTKSSRVDTSKQVKLPSASNEFGMYHVQVESLKSGTMQVSQGGVGLIDTGTTNLFVSAELAYDIYATIVPATYFPKERPESGSYMIPCTKVAGVADLSLTFGGLDWPIAYEDLVGPTVGNSTAWCWGRVSEVTGSPSYQFLVGSVFLKNVYTAFNISDGSVAFYGLK